MPIKVISHAQVEQIEYDGRVIEVHKSMQVRNVSDTLDYTDMQTVEVTEALVYKGRRGTKFCYETMTDVEVELPIDKRFVWIDCTNMFAYRGADRREPQVDPPWKWMIVEHALEDHVAWVAWKKAEAEERAAAHRKQLEEEQRLKAERQRNAPVKGKKMIVFKGRKVPIGTVGVVAFIHENGGVLLKPEESWRDRRTQGVWVNVGNLKAFEEEK